MSFDCRGFQLIRFLELALSFDFRFFRWLQSSELALSFDCRVFRRLLSLQLALFFDLRASRPLRSSEVELVVGSLIAGNSRYFSRRWERLWVISSLGTVAVALFAGSGHGCSRCW